ncbi:MAG: metallophosphoesterase, partial [Candidatus Dormibacteraeota bacterium]|nr:metallophosphoesterase [Candidatus Dormibacteraeota bacterium]
MTYRLLHLADVHLDRTFAALGGDAQLARRRRQGLKDALRTAGRVAAERSCQAVTIGGDLYEHERAGADTERFLVETFASWQPLHVFIAPGNHDALLPGSLYRRAAWPDNVHIFSGSRLEPLELADGLTLWGLAHREPVWQGDPLGGTPPPEDSGVHLALFHGAELGSRPDGKGIHGPFVAEAIRGMGFAAALCGHYHRRRLDPALGLLYPGSPEPLRIDETGDRGPVLVTVESDGAVTMEALSLNRWQAHCLDCDVEGAGSADTVLDRIEAAAVIVLDGDLERSLLRIDCTGELDPALSLDTATMEAVLRERLGVAAVGVRDLTQPSLDLDEAEAEHSARGAFLRATRAAIQAAADEDEASILEDARR